MDSEPTQYQINASPSVKTLSMSVNSDEKEIINTYLSQIQTENEVIFTSFKEFVLFLINQRSIAEKSEITIEKEIVEKEIEKIVEVEKELDENQVLLTLDENQLEVAKAIAQNRATKLGIENQTLDQVFIQSFFNKGNLFNWSGNFYTGL
jgi:hypothetical protein